jgi:hypothetical protein
VFVLYCIYKFKSGSANHADRREFIVYY